MPIFFDFSINTAFLPRELTVNLTVIYLFLTDFNFTQLNCKNTQKPNVQAVFEHFELSWQKKNSSPKTAVFGAGDRT